MMPYLRLISRGLRRTVPLVAVLVAATAWPVLAQVAPGNGYLAMRSDGFLFWIQDGQRHLVYPQALPDEQINALPEGVPLTAALVPGAESSQPVVGQPSALGPAGTSRADRLSFGQTCQCFLVRGTGQRSDLQIQVVSTQREAWAVLRTTHPANQVPKEGFEYIIVTLNLKYAGGPRDLPLSLDRSDFFMLDSNDVLYVPAFVVEPQPLLSTTAYPGTDVTGSVTFQVPRGDPDPVLVWRYHDENPTWFAVQ